MMDRQRIINGRVFISQPLFRASKVSWYFTRHKDKEWFVEEWASSPEHVWLEEQGWPVHDLEVSVAESPDRFGVHGVVHGWIESSVLTMFKLKFYT